MGAAHPPEPPKAAAKKDEKSKIPAWQQPPFMKQTNRVQAVHGKLLEVRLPAVDAIPFGGPHRSRAITLIGRISKCAVS